MLKKTVLVLGVFIIAILFVTLAFKETNKISTKNLSHLEPLDASSQAEPVVSSGPVTHSDRIEDINRLEP